MAEGKSSGDVQTLAEAGKPNVQKLPWATGYVGAAAPDAPLYRVNRQCFLHGKLHEPGDLIRWDGKPASYMTLVEEGPQPAAKEGAAAKTETAPQVAQVATEKQPEETEETKESAVLATRKRSRRKR